MSANHTGRCWLLSEMAEGGKMLLVGGLEVCTLAVTDDVGYYNIIF